MTHSSLAGEPLSARSIGIVGGGQLAWMLAREARKLGVELHVQTPDPTDPATREASSVVVGNLDDPESIRALARRVERISFENEWVPLDVLRPLEGEGISFLPDLTSSEIFFAGSFLPGVFFRSIVRCDSCTVTGPR